MRRSDPIPPIAAFFAAGYKKRPHDAAFFDRFHGYEPLANLPLCSLYAFAFAAFFVGLSTSTPRFFCHQTQRPGTKQMELKVPIAMPNIIGTEKLRMESRPIASATMVTTSMEPNVVIEVRRLRRRD